MADIRLHRMAQVLVHHSLGIEKGMRLGIETGPLAIPLLYEIVREAIRVGAHPEIFLQLPTVQEIVLKDGSDDQIRYVPTYRKVMFEEFETVLQIKAEENLKRLSNIKFERLALMQQIDGNVRRTMMRRALEGSVRNTLTLFPTNAYAQDANMSLHDFEDFFYSACFLDEEDPVVCWQEISQQQEQLIQWLHGKHTIRVHAQDTDLTLSVKGRTWLNEDGRYNFPGGEFFTSPVETSAQGSIYFNALAIHNGHSVKGVHLYFEDGLVVEARAAQGQEYLDKILQLDEGARHLGEFAFGNNHNVNICTGNILFDEKLGGTVHLALGSGFPPAGGVNRSAIHWDMVCDLRQGGEVHVDGVLFCKDGTFVVDLLSRSWSSRA
jgi:aminopeptidase